MTKRDVSLPSQEKIAGQVQKASSLLTLPLRTLKLQQKNNQPDKSRTEKKTVESVSTEAPKDNTPSTTTPIKEPTLPTEGTVRAIPKTSVYIPMQEGSSDTDESYRPSISPCEVAMGWKIGTFDTRFGISKEQFSQDIQDAAETWGSVIDTQLFTYNQNGPLTINLVYDERQAATLDISYLALEIENSKQAAENTKADYESEKTDYLAKGDQYTIDTDIFKTNYKVYDDKVAAFNAKGGAPKDEYDKMMLELADLKSIAAALEVRRVAINAMMNDINAKVVKYNDLVAYINTLIKKSNSLGAKKFTEGRFVPSTDTIDVYQFNDTTKLRRVITHELGHAIGINHNDNVQSIMYAVNSGTSTDLTKEDIKSLKKVCQ
jgi:hypothetical protein